MAHWNYLFEADTRLRKLEREHAANPTDRRLAKRLEKAYYQNRQYVDARRVRLAYLPFDIPIARTGVIHEEGSEPYRIVLYLEKMSGGKPMWVTWVQGDKGNYWGHRFRDFHVAYRDFRDRSAVYGARTDLHSLDKLPDGYPSSVEVYQSL